MTRIARTAWCATITMSCVAIAVGCATTTAAEHSREHGGEHSGDHSAPPDLDATCLAAHAAPLKSAAMPEHEKAGACAALSSMPELRGFVVDTLSHVLVLPGATLLTDRAVATLRGPAVDAGALGARCELLRGERGWAVESCAQLLDGARLQDVDVEAAARAMDVVEADPRFASAKIVLVARATGDEDTMVVVSFGDSPFALDETVVYLKGDKIVRTRVIKGIL